MSIFDMDGKENGMNTFDHALEDYDRGLLAARQGRFMAADHFFLRAVKRAYGLDGLGGKVEAARRLGEIYADLGLLRMAARHYVRALKLLTRSGISDSPLHEDIADRYARLCAINLDAALHGLGIDASGTGPVPRTEAHCTLVTGVLRSLHRNGTPTLGECERAAFALNRQDCATGRGEPWTAAMVLRLCSVHMLE